MPTGGPKSRSVDQAATPDRLQRRTSRLLSQLTVRSDRLINNGLAIIGARKWHYAVLASLEEHGPGSQANLSNRSGIYRSDLVGVLNELASDELIDREPDLEDRRRNVVKISSKGRRRLRRLDAVLDELQDELLAPLSQPERIQLFNLLSRLLDHHSQLTS